MLLCSVAAVFYVYTKADFSQRPEVSFLKWFGLHFDELVSLAVGHTLFLNSCLFAGKLSKNSL